MPRKSSFRVLFVDDEPGVAEFFASALEDLTGFQVQPFADPYLALQTFLKEPFHLVITDIMMPRIDGYELIKRLKEQQPSCAFIVLTAHKDIEVVSRTNRLGASYIFFKPFDIDALVEAVNDVHKRHLYWQKQLAELEKKNTHEQ